MRDGVVSDLPGENSNRFCYDERGIRETNPTILITDAGIIIIVIDVESVNGIRFFVV